MRKRQSKGMRILEFQRITSRENPVVKSVRALQSSAKERKKAGLFVLEGLRICRDAYENNVCLKRLIVSESAFEKHKDEILPLLSCAESRVLVPDGLFRCISDTQSPQGISAIAYIPENKYEPQPDGRYLGLENVSDPSNLGAAARTAEALGVSGIAVSGGCDVYAPKSLRASMGTLLRLPIYITDDLTDFAKKYSLRTVACVVSESALPITEVSFGGGDLLLIGNEANGLRQETCDRCDICATIPMKGSAESLNAAAAAAIGMWEMMRR